MFTLKDPKLWWTNGLGEQHLYDFTVEVKAGGNVMDRHEQKIGIRSLRVVIEPDKWGEGFYVELNGAPVFMKGANHIQSRFFCEYGFQGFRRFRLFSVLRRSNATGR